MAQEKVIHLTADEFHGFIEKAEMPVLVDFWAPWCGPCRMLGPVIDQLAEDYDGKAAVCKVNIDEEGDIAMEYRIMTIPTVLVFSKNEAVEKVVGVVQKEELAALIDKHL